MSRLSRQFRKFRSGMARALHARVEQTQRFWRSLPMLRWSRAGRHNAIYDAPYYEMVEEAANWSCKVMANSIIRDLGPSSILDLGCGTGALLKEIQSRGVAACGLEYSTAGLQKCLSRKLDVHRFDIGRDKLRRHWMGRDVAMSFEVAEHLPAHLADRFLELLTAASDVVVLSAATPGQGGTDHVNEQPHSYWIEKMQKRGYWFDEQLSIRWRAEWSGKTATWYQANVMVFRKTAQSSNMAVSSAA